MNIFTQTHTFNTDRYTAVGLYNELRNHHRKPCLLESNDYHTRSESKSFIGLDPLIEIRLTGSGIERIVNNKSEHIPVQKPSIIALQLQKLLEEITYQQPHDKNGILNYFSFEFAQLGEGKMPEKDNKLDLPLAHFIVYRTLLVFDHFHDTGILFHNTLEPQNKPKDFFDQFLHRTSFTEFPFELEASEETSVSDASFLSLVDNAKNHIRRGDVFQLVVSRPFSRPFFGDDFQVYRQLRRLNPSPYLFYIDWETHRLFGSSPETQIALRNGIASIHPIAGTVRKTGEETLDQQAIRTLINDEKENAEHTMLVDLARNDLSKCCSHVRLTSFKEIQHFSHVIHLVSTVIGQTETNALNLFSETFPAGTLSGTPKPKAIELIDRYEEDPRGYYGGAIGFLTASGDMNLAIIIRSVLSKNNRLHYRAGAGVVIDSKPKNELQEVTNKLGAVRLAMQLAHQTFQS